jgi:type I restriction enzyme S subunit
MTANDLIAAFETLADAPDGVKRVRELVLQLAVRGKLVPQNATDDPAEELLLAVRRERFELFRASGRQPAGSLPCELPQGWAVTTFDELGAFVGGKTPSKAKARYWGGSIPWVSPKDMKTADIQGSEDHVTEAALREGLAEVPIGAILVVVRSGILRRTVPVAIARVRCTVNQDLKALCPCPSVKPEYVRLMIMGFERVILAELTKIGTTVESMKFDEFAAQRFPLPPPAEQNRIVARVDELMGLLDRLEVARTARDDVRRAARDAALAALRDAQDTDAVDAAWGRIAGQMDELFANSEDVGPLREIILDLGVRGRLVAECSEVDWTTVKLEDACTHIVDCLHRTPRYTDSGFPAIRTTDIKPGRILWESARKVPESEFLEQTRRLLPQPGDVFYAREGNWGDAAVVPDGVPMCLSQRTMQFRLSKLVDPFFFAWLLNSPGMRRRIGTRTVGMTVPHVNIGDLRKLILRIPPLADQHRIVAKVDALMEICDDLEARLMAARILQGQFAAAAVHHLDV